VQVLLQATADPNAGSSCSECARNRGFPKIAKLLAQQPPGCIEGFVYQPSAVFRKWSRRYFFVSVSRGIIFINPNCSTPSVLRAPDSQPADEATFVHARGSRIAQLDSFEGKQYVIKICSRPSEVSFDGTSFCY
jgi:hypothetical protein